MVDIEEPIKRTRKRVVKKDAPDHVYSVNGIEGENLDTKASKKKALESAQLFPAPMVTETEPAVNPFPKHRGRKSKAELEYLARMAEEMSKSQAPVEQDITPDNEYSDNNAEMSEMPEMKDTPITADEQVADNYGLDEDRSLPEENIVNDNIIAQLQEKMNAQNVSGEDCDDDDEAEDSNEEDIEPVDNGGVWLGDPGDGTDFITIEDLPIEDTNMTVNVDIFDNPQTNKILPSSLLAAEENVPCFDFQESIKTIGLTEVMAEGYAFLRSSDYNYLSSPDDVFIPMPKVRKLGIKTGDMVECTVCPPNTGDKYFILQDVIRINGREPQEIRDRVPFEHLTPLFPDEKFNLCNDPQTTNLSTRIVDLFSPIGKGQRALIVAQPKTGKTILMKDIANAIASSHPEAYLMMLLIDERPEEVTDMARTVNAEVIASTFDEPADRHVKIAGLVLEKAKRMVECGHDVVIFLDSITRLARAYNTVAPTSGKVLTGGVDANALQKPKRFFGAARNIEGGGSLTIIATALIDTGSKMDEVIFEEFKGTGNMELQLERTLANKRIFPAANLILSSTRRDDMLQDKTTLDRMWILRKYISDMNPIEAMTEIQNRMRVTRDNEEFLLTMNS
ncbi:MAG: transcription termination factor Rho [Bacteroidales bacterium]|nr:transcription termination factor Rho [Bacteroidales bacterium]MCM1148401.1 transcription termination factor Rho [Bacteroidales bacterium]MCM1207148.1 transcription termination factor Rho [Bacillota bacterium]MCM1511381.1 transcription termination factor Rho [Clostridium sp.]